jgi:acetyltransferase-like isoleucine patch superfamily enzyme
MRVILGFLLYSLKKFNRICIHHYFNARYRKSCQVAGKVRFNGISRISGGKSVRIESNVHIGDNAYIRGEGGVTIGENTHISRNLVLYTHNHNYTGKRLPYDDTFVYKPVIIGRNVWIGMNVIVLPGTKVGDGAVIGAGSVVSGKVEPGAIVVAPQQVPLKMRDMDHYSKLDREEQYGGPNGKALS